MYFVKNVMVLKKVSSTDFTVSKPRFLSFKTVKLARKFI